MQFAVHAEATSLEADQKYSGLYVDDEYGQCLDASLWSVFW